MQKSTPEILKRSKGIDKIIQGYSGGLTTTYLGLGLDVGYLAQDSDQPCAENFQFPGVINDETTSIEAHERMISCKQNLLHSNQ